MTTTRKTASYLQRYEPEDEGLRFVDIKFTGNYHKLDPLPDGILGDRMMRQRAESKVLEKLSHEDVLRDQLTIEELNDLNNYYSWNIWDVLAMRATEGVSGMIPRQEYEILAFMHEYLRYPEFMQYVTDKIGAQGVIDIGKSARSEIGTKVNCVHDWCLSACCAMGRCGLLALEWMEPDEWVQEYNTILKFGQRVLWGKRQDGYMLNSQDRYRCAIHEQDLQDRMYASLERFDGHDEKHSRFTQFNAAAELLAFFDHYDCRLGLGDTGPYIRDDGTFFIVRDLFVNEDIYHWSDVCEGLPHAFTLVLLMDPMQMNLAEIRVNDISTTFTRPTNYIPHIIGGAVWAREQHDTPMDEVYQIPIMELGGQLELIQKATFNMYKKTVKMSKRQLVTNGIYSYYIEMILPHLRKAGLYEEIDEKFDFWEIDRRISDAYYDIKKRNFAQETVPLKIFSGSGYLPIPKGTPTNRSKYRIT